MSMKVSRPEYAAQYGPTTGDKIYLADTGLVAKIETDIPPTATSSCSAAAKPSVTAWARRPNGSATARSISSSPMP